MLCRLSPKIRIVSPPRRWPISTDYSCSSTIVQPRRRREIGCFRDLYHKVSRPWTLRECFGMIRLGPLINHIYSSWCRNNNGYERIPVVREPKWKLYLSQKTKAHNLESIYLASREPNQPPNSVKRAPKYMLRLSQLLLRLWSGRA